MAEGIRGSAANVTQALHDIDFPCGKQQLLQQAQRNNADRDVLEILQKMPEQQYSTMADVMKGFGQVQ